MPAPHQPANALGIDVAHFDGDINWEKVLSVGGRSFGFVKATEGTNNTDSKCIQNLSAMAAVGITRGVYHLFRSNLDAETQAAHFLNVYGPHRLKTDMPPVIDVETPDNTGAAQRINGVQKWLDVVETGLRAMDGIADGDDAPNTRPIIYTFPSFWPEHMGNTHQFSDAGYLLWIARFSTTLTSPDPLPGGWADWVFWQFAAGEAGTVHVPGVPGAVDADRYNGTHADLVTRFGLAP